MEGNHLHRYSKVLEGHLGTARSRILPTCPRVIYAASHPINKSAPSNLFQQQKLLSIGLDESVPLGRRHVEEDLIESLEAKENFGNGAAPHIQGGGGAMQDIDSNSVFPVLAFIGTGLVLLFLLNQYYRGRSKPRRKKPRLKKFPTMLYGTKGPSV
ncbi:membrane-bound transcription factor site-1 protease-like [Saccostrea cucullata]